VSYEEPQQEPPSFTGTSSQNREEALHDAAERAQEFFKEQGREGKILLQVVSEEVAIGNPHITEWRIIITESGGG
jgi:hypothetical protein